MVKVMRLSTKWKQILKNNKLEKNYTAGFFFNMKLLFTCSNCFSWSSLWTECIIGGPKKIFLLICYLGSLSSFAWTKYKRRVALLYYLLKLWNKYEILSTCCSCYYISTDRNVVTKLQEKWPFWMRFLVKFFVVFVDFLRGHCRTSRLNFEMLEINSVCSLKI